MDLTEDKIKEKIAAIPLPWSAQLLGESGLIKSVQIDGEANIIIVAEVPVDQGKHHEDFRQNIIMTLQEMNDVKSAEVILTAERAPQKPENDPHGMSKNPKLNIPVKHIIAVASGKGGVGKSTVAANLAVSFAGQGLKTGLLDADIYGPSAPMLMGLQGQKPETNKDNKLEPIEAHGVKVMSIGFLVNQDEPMIWRGPMVQTAIYQLFRDVNWDGLDVLIIDMPPGTGDAQLTLAQKVNVTGAVIVSTPQDLALLDARKGIEMFRKTNVPILGLIENMSVFICPECGHEEHIFSHDTLEAEATRLNVPYLGSLPLTKEIREASDGGAPVALKGDFADYFSKLTEIILKAL